MQQDALKVLKKDLAFYPEAHIIEFACF